MMVLCDVEMDGMHECFVSERHETQPYQKVLRQIPPAIPGTYGRMILSVV